MSDQNQQQPVSLQERQSPQQQVITPNVVHAIMTPQQLQQSIIPKPPQELQPQQQSVTPKPPQELQPQQLKNLDAPVLVASDVDEDLRKIRDKMAKLQQQEQRILQQKKRAEDRQKILIGVGLLGHFRKLAARNELTPEIKNLFRDAINNGLEQRDRVEVQPTLDKWLK